MNIFRAVPRAAFKPNEVFAWRDDSRLPGNLPYLVDNLWEYTRPAHLPSRRKSVFASPSAALALEGASAGRLGPDQYLALEVHFHMPPTKLLQLSVKDARYHRDVGELQKLVHKLLNEPERWSRRALDRKLALAPLFVPGTTAAELSLACEHNAELRAVVDAATALVTMWSDTPDPAAGEISFELDQANFYTLRPIP